MTRPLPEGLDRNQELLEQATTAVYKQIPGGELTASIFTPDDLKPGDNRPACVFFYSSLWDNGMISQFAPHCVRLAARGMVTIICDYRVTSRFSGSGPLASLQDARSAIRWIRLNASQLGINPGQIAAAGGSGGAYLAAASAILENEELDDSSEDPTVSCVPNALILFSPVIDTTKKGAGMDKFPDAKIAKTYSLLHQVRKDLPPTLIFHGKEDRVVPYEGVAKFAKLMKRRRNDCELITYDAEGHGFFNFNVNLKFFEGTLRSTDGFLVDQGFLEPGEEAEFGIDERL